MKSQRPEPAWFSQDRHRCRLEWGHRGAKAAADRGDILVVVDVLSFSTTVATAAHHGVVIYPSLTRDKFHLAERVGAEVAFRRHEVPKLGRFSLSPRTFVGADRGTKVVLESLNGATCCILGKPCPHIVIGCLNNARAIAENVNGLLEFTERGVTILACGERWQTRFDDEQLRMAVEDYLGAGAIISHIRVDKSSEAKVAAAAFEGVSGRLEETLLFSGSGIELCGKNFADDVRHAAKLDLYKCVPVVQADGSIVPMESRSKA